MKEINKIFCKTIFIVFFIFSAQAESKVLSIGSPDAKVTIKVFSSLTCPHCANFHSNIYEKLKKEYIDKGLVKFEHHAFPLDLAALNAEIIIRCNKVSEKKFELLTEMYSKQKSWAIGSDINKINDFLIKIGVNSKIKESDLRKCLQNEKTQELILEERIKAQKEYNITSTPTIYINDKKYEDKQDFRSFKRIIDKLL